MSIYGYCRISTKSQSIERQIRNIRQEYPSAIIKQEIFTGTKIVGRKVLDGLVNNCAKSGDTIVFDSASRMSRNADEAVELYEQLFNEGVNLVFLKEPYINSEVYKKTLENSIKINVSTGSTSTDGFISKIIDALNSYAVDLAKDQIRAVFEQAEKEVQDLRVRTEEGIVTARIKGKQIGIKRGQKLVTQKSIAAKKDILKYCKDFNGSLTDVDTIKLIGISKNSYYKYKRELREELTI